MCRSSTSAASRWPPASRRPSPPEILERPNGMAGNLAPGVFARPAGAEQSVNVFRHIDTGESALVAIRHHTGRDLTGIGWFPTSGDLLPPAVPERPSPSA